MSIQTRENLVVDRENPKTYTSIYGYEKQGLWVKTVSGSCIGFIKREAIIGEKGEVAGYTYYTRSDWRGNGQPRFFSSPEALILAYGGHLEPVIVTKKARVKAVAKKTRKVVAKAKTKAVVKTKTRTRVMAPLKKTRRVSAYA